MITFDPPELKDEFIAAIRVLYKFAEITLSDWEHIHEEDFDFEDTLDVVVTNFTEFTFHAGADSTETLTCRELIDLATELPGSKVIDNQLYVSATRAYVRIEAANEAATQFEQHVYTYGTSTPRLFETTAGDVRLALVHGYTPFALHILKEGEYDSDTYPTYHENELFIEVRYPSGTKDNAWRPLIPALLFEVAEQTGMAFAQARRGTLAELWPAEYGQESYVEKFRVLRLRQLLSGAGDESLIRISERASGRETDPEQHFVGYVKVIEYVSATVVNTERNAQIRRRLLSPRALSPDAAFIRDLTQLIEAQRACRKDAEALRMTIETCCDSVELARCAPPSQRALKTITEASPPADRKKALESLSATLSATRNMYSHAKANYTLPGAECSEAELPELTRCARLAAQQCVRWFSHSHMSLRIID